MDFDTAVAYLRSYTSYEDLADFQYQEENFNLERFRTFLDAYGIDYAKLKCVHIAGSKGKGTVANLMARYYADIGQRTGLFTSPYMLNIRECFWISGELISQDEFVGYVMELSTFMEVNDFQVTYFELLTALVFKYFLDQGVEMAVIEVGLGGRLDSTNVVTPDLAVITRIEKEHADILGDTLGEIVGEKLGIVKDGPVIVGFQSLEARDLIQERLVDKNAIWADEQELSDYNVNDAARLENARVAEAALKQLLGEAFDVGAYKVLVENFRLVGRFDVREVDGKTIVFDMAHTKNSLANLLDGLKSRFQEARFVFLFGILKDKEVDDCLKLLVDFSDTDQIVFTSSHPERGMSPEELFALMEGLQEDVVIDTESDANSAYLQLLQELKENQVLVVTGSHFLISQVLPG